MRSSGEVEGVVDFREEEAVLVRSLKDEAPEAESRSDCFPDEGGEAMEGDLGFRDVVVEMEGSVESGRREVALVSAAPVEIARLVGSAVGRALGRRGDFEVAFVRGLVILTSSGSSPSVFTRKGSVPIIVAGRSRRTGFLQGLGSSRSTRRFSGRRRKHL